VARAHPTAILDILTTWPGPSDFDVYFQDDAGTTLQQGGANAGMPEHLTYVPVAGVNHFRIRTLVFAAVNETFHCTVKLFETPPVNTGVAIYQPSTDVFSCNKHLEGRRLAFDHGGDGEPAVAIQPDGTTLGDGHRRRGRGHRPVEDRGERRVRAEPDIREPARCGRRRWRYGHRDRDAAECARLLQHLTRRA
jgi:hypothetical protein